MNVSVLAPLGLLAALGAGLAFLVWYLPRDGRWHPHTRFFSTDTFMRRYRNGAWEYRSETDAEAEDRRDLAVW